MNNKCCRLALPNSGNRRFWSDHVSDWIDYKLQRNGTCDFSHLMTCKEDPIPVCSITSDVMCPDEKRFHLLLCMNMCCTRGYVPCNFVQLVVPMY